MRFFHIAILVLASLLLQVPSQAQTEGAGAPTPAKPTATDVDNAQALRRGAVSKISIRGQRKVEADAIRANIRSQVGAAPNSLQLRDDIRRIYAMGLFADVRLFRDAGPGDTVHLIFEVVEKPSVHEVLYEGNEKVSKDDIEEVVDIEAFQVLDVPKLRRNVEKIKNLYLEKGYYLAEIRYDLRPVAKDAPPAKIKDRDGKAEGRGHGRRGHGPGGMGAGKGRRPQPSSAMTMAGGEQVDVVFVINEKAKVLIERLALVGNHALSDDEIKPFLETREGNLISFITSWGTYKAEAFKTDLMRIEAIYHDHGYIEVKVGNPQVRLSADKTHMFISIPIDEGEQYKLGEKDIAGDLIKDKDELMKAVTLKEGEIFKRSTVAKDIDRLANEYKDVGYAFVNISPITKLHTKDKLVDLNLEIEKGPLVTIERIEVEGNDKTRDKVIRRELRVYEGELYTATGLRESERRVKALGYFETVDFGTKRGSQADRIIVTVKVKEKSTGTFQVSFGFSSYEQFVGQAQVVQDNFLGFGTRLSLTGQLSSRRRIFNLQYLEPYLLDTTWSLSVNLFNSENDYYEFQRASTGGDLTLGHPLDFGIRYLDNVFLYLTYFAERVTIPEEAFNVTLAGLETDLPRWTSSLRGTISYDSRDNRLFPSDGYYALLRAEWATPYLLSENEFSRLTGITQGYWPLWWGLVLRANARLGYIWSPKRVPVFESYRAGGYSSIRGYYTRTIGPTLRVGGLDPSGGLQYFNAGGNKDFLTNLEIEFPLIEQVGIRGVLFFDTANTFAANENFFYLGQSPNPLNADLVWDPVRDLPLGVYSSVGLGIRWMSPMGPLRFEWGFPLNRRPVGSPGWASGDDLFLFEFNIGNSF